MTQLPGADDRDTHACFDRGVGAELTLVETGWFLSAALGLSQALVLVAIATPPRSSRAPSSHSREICTRLSLRCVDTILLLWGCFMSRSLAGPSRSLPVLAVCCAMMCASVARAATVNFEAPSYAVGSIVGQDGWAAAGYFPAPNGLLEVSTASPLAGGQSLRYTRTEAGLAANGSDVVKTDVVTVAKDGTPAADLSASFLISSSSLSAQGMGFGVNGLYLSPAGASGATPIGIRLNNAGSSIPSIEEIADFGGSPAFFYFGGTLAAASFPENDILEFDIDVDFDSSTYTVGYRNVTSGGAFISSGFTRGFAVSYPANPNGSMISYMPIPVIFSSSPMMMWCGKKER